MPEQNKQDNKLSYNEISINAIKLFNEVGKDIHNSINKNKATLVFNNKTKIDYNKKLNSNMEDLKEEIKARGYDVELIEYIDMKNVTKDSKYMITIKDLSNCYVEFSYFEYREVMLDYMRSEQDYIYSMLVKMAGNEQNDLEDTAKLICFYLAVLCHYKELHIKVYNTLGWDYYNGNLIFKYDKIYSNPIIPEQETQKQEYDPLLELAYMLKGRNIMDISDSLVSKHARMAEQLEMWIPILVDVMNSSEKASLIIAAACTGLVRQILPYSKEDNINMNIQGKPGSGKSIICHFALSLFGDPQILEGSFIDTDNSMELIRVQRPVIPYILDERMLKIEGNSEKAKKQAILIDVFREYEGKAKEKLTGKGSEYAGQRTNAPIISSSVEHMLDVLISTGKDLGQYRRFIEINLDRNEIFHGNSDYANYIESVAYSNYGFGVEIIVSYILEKFKEDADYVENKYNSNCKEISEILRKKQEEEDIQNLLSSNKRFSLVITTLDILIESILFYTRDLEGDKIDTTLHDKVIEILVDNLVEKMLRVGEKVDVAYNFENFIKNNSQFLATKQKDYTSNKGNKPLMGYYEEKDGTIEISLKNNRGYEWIVCGGVDLEKDKIEEYISKVDKLNANSDLTKIIELHEKYLGYKKILKNMAIGNENYMVDIGTKHLNMGDLIRIKLTKKEIKSDNLSDSDKEDKKE